MHNIKDIRKNPEKFNEDLKNRFVSVDLKKILSIMISAANNLRKVLFKD